jgi:hypothetical protein
MKHGAIATDDPAPEPRFFASVVPKVWTRGSSVGGTFVQIAAALGVQRSVLEPPLTDQSVRQ